MSDLGFTLVRIIPEVLQLAVGLVGLIVSVQARSRGGSGVMAGAFAVMLAATAAAIAWQFVVLDAASWITSAHLGNDEVQTIFTLVGLVLDGMALLSWILVAVAVAKGGRRPQPPAYPPPGYPVQPGFATPPSGYPQPGYPPHPQDGPPQS